MALAYYDDEQDKLNDPIQFVRRSMGLIIGALFLVLALAFSLIFLTFSIDDPSLINRTTNSPQNALGAFGAWIAGPTIQVLGRGVWLIPIALFAWSGRGFIGKPLGHFLGRFMWLPLALLICAAFASTHSVSASWPFENLGMGGEFGDSIASFIIGFFPFGISFSLFVSTIVLSIVASLVTLFISGFHIYEVAGILAKILIDLRTVFTSISNKIKDAANSFLAVTAHKSASTDQIDENPTAQQLQNASQANKALGLTKGVVATIGAGITAILTKNSFKKDNSRSNRYLKRHNVNADPSESTNHSDSMTLSERIKVLAKQNQSDHQNLLKRSINPDEENLEKEPEQSDISNALRSLTRSESQLEDTSQFQSPPENTEAEGSIVKPIRNSLFKKSSRARAEAEPMLAFDPQTQGYEKPSLSMLKNPELIARHVTPKESLEASARHLETVLDDYGVKGEIVSVRPGPVVTMYELEPAAGLKASRVIGLADDIARSMSALSARVATIPGRSVIGIELPNENREMVLLREIFSSKDYGDSKYPLPLALGKDIAGDAVVANLAKMPHLLIAGTTGSGKSVAINTMILSLLYHADPDEVRMIMIDPKMLELSVYDDIPHLLSPVVTDPHKAVVALKWVVGEMEERYRKMSKMGVRNIDGYNERVADALAKGEGFTRTIQTGFDDLTGEPVFETEEYAPEKMPYIVVVVDEMADLMMVSGKEIEACIQRLAQMARASGIHLIMATQRPSVDVITGTIKANFPTRISFQVTSKIDSRTILGEMGAEQLLGQGDMLYMSGGGRVTRVHGPFVSDLEVEEVVRHLKSQGEPEYLDSVLNGSDENNATNIDAILGLGSGNESEDSLFDEAVAIVARDRKVSTSYIQRKLSIGYNKAATLVERMEEEGMISPANHVGKREVLLPEIN